MAQDPEKLSNGQIFKQRNGYSKTMKRLMHKYNCATTDEYRAIRRKNKKKHK